MSKVLKFAVKAGTTVESVDLKTFLNLPILLPPKEEQKNIAEVLTTHDARITAEEAHLDKLKQIKKGLMHDLLTGLVRVTEFAAGDDELDQAGRGKGWGEVVWGP